MYTNIPNRVNKKERYKKLDVRKKKRTNRSAVRLEKAWDFWYLRCGSWFSKRAERAMKHTEREWNGYFLLPVSNSLISQDPLAISGFYGDTTNGMGGEYRLFILLSLITLLFLLFFIFLYYYSWLYTYNEYILIYTLKNNRPKCLRFFTEKRKED